MSTRTYTVSGMTCGHCVASVTEEVSEVPGVSDVRVDLESGALTLATDGPDGPDDAVDAAVRAAVEEAGYQLVR